MVAVTDVAQSVGLSIWLKQEQWIVSPVADGSGTAFSDMNLDFDKKWICTIKLVDRIYGSEVEMKNLSYLRYRLDLDVDDSVIAHRADADVLVTAKLLEHLTAAAIEKELIDPTKNIPVVEEKE